MSMPIFCTWITFNIHQCTYTYYQRTKHWWHATILLLGWLSNYVAGVSDITNLSAYICTDNLIWESTGRFRLKVFAIHKHFLSSGMAWSWAKILGKHKCVVFRLNWTLIFTSHSGSNVFHSYFGGTQIVTLYTFNRHYFQMYFRVW